MTILIAAAGTGGHVFPGLAVAESLLARGVDVHWLHTEKGKESVWLQDYPISCHQVEIQGLRGKGIMGWLAMPMRLFRAVRQAIAVLRAVKPQAILVMGGYVSVPVGLAAKLLGIPLVVHEQNAIAGMSNKLLAPVATRVYMGLPLQAWPLGFEEAECVGNPLRRQLQRGVYLPNKTGALRVLILGGSQGASFLNATLPAVCTGWQWKDQLEIWHQTGTTDYEQVHEAYHAAKVNARVDEFIYDMATAYAWADVVIARAGAMTVSELTQVAKPALFIPYPFAVDNHQQANAQALVDMGAAWMVVQSKASMDVLRYQLSEWLQHPELLDEAGQILLSLPDNCAGEIIADALIALGSTH